MCKLVLINCNFVGYAANIRNPMVYPGNRSMGVEDYKLCTSDAFHTAAEQKRMCQKTGCKGILVR